MRVYASAAVLCFTGFKGALTLIFSVVRAKHFDPGSLFQYVSTHTFSKHFYCSLSLDS